MKIFINPGHDTRLDPGACGNGLQEAQVALKVGNRVADYLRAVGYEVKVFQYDGLAEICDDANNWNADIFVSIHCNAANSVARGTETYSSGYAEGKKLAAAIQKQMLTKIPSTIDRGVKERGFYVLKYTDMPAVLVEMAFIDNAQDAKLLVDHEDDFARAIACGVTDYVGANSKPVPDVVDKPTKAASSATKLSEHFDKSEFACHHCGQCTNMHPRLIELLEQLRTNIGGLPLHINSGYRCPTHNANVGGVPNSQHVLGTAADLGVPSALSLGEFLNYVKKLPFDWIGVYPSSYFIHVDVRNGGVGGVVDYME